MSVSTLCVVLYLVFFIGSCYSDGVPMLHYSAPVIKATIDDVKVCHCVVVTIFCPLGSLTLTCVVDLG
jgi:hypothetical protein